MKTVGKHADDEEQFEIVRGFAQLLDSNGTLEVGCGYMRFASLFRKYTGIDKNPAVSPDHVMDATHLKFQDDSFDLVFSCTALMHNQKISAILREMARVSRHYILLIESAKQLRSAYRHDYVFDDFIKILELKLITPRSPLRVWLFKKIRLSVQSTNKGGDRGE